MKFFISLIPMLLITKLAISTPMNTEKMSKSKEALKKLEGYQTTFNIGLGFGFQTDLYKSGNSSIPLIPVAGFKYKNLFAYGTTLGYTFRWGWPTLSLAVNPELMSLKGESQTITQGLKERKMTLNGGLKALFPTKLFIASIDIYHDIFNRYNDFQTTLELNRYMKINKRFHFVLGLGLDWLPSGYTDYYFGISQGEALVSPRFYRPQFQGRDSFRTRLRLIAIYELTKKVSLVFINEYSRFKKEIYESPIVRSKDQNRTYFTATYSF